MHRSARCARDASTSRHAAGGHKQSLRRLLPLLVALPALACASTPKRLTYDELASAAMGKNMKYAVYEPKQRESKTPLPLLIFLHGGGDSVDCFDKASIGQHLDTAIAAGRIPPVVVAVPEGDLGFWENWADGSHMYRDWVLQEMLPQVQQQYNTMACPEGCHVMGISMGGHGALRFAFKAPQLFKSVTALSAPIFTTEQMLKFKKSFWWGLFVPMKRIWGKSKDPKLVAQDDLYQQWTQQSDLQGLSLRIGWGTEDRKGVIATNRAFEKHLTEHNIEHTLDVFPGEHEWDAWLPAIERAIAAQLK